MIDVQKLEEITHKHLRIDYRKIYASDANYSIPTKNWVVRNFKKYFKNKMHSDKTLGMIWKDKHDCDNFATAYRMYMQSLHSIQEGESGQSIAVAEIWFMQDNGGAHAINMVIVDNYEPLFIEPQTGNQIRLSNQEKKSTWFVRY